MSTGPRRGTAVSTGPRRGTAVSTGPRGLHCRGRLAAGLALIALVTVLAGCGVPLQQSAEPLPSNLLPARPTVPPTPSPTPTTSPTRVTSPTPSPEPQPAHLRLWFVQDDGLAAVESDLPLDATAAQIIDGLAAGPAPDQAAGGLRTVVRDPLTGTSLVSIADAAETPPVVASPSDVFYPQALETVRLSPAFTALPPNEQVLLLGQVVLSLAGAGEAAVTFTDDAGSAVAVPLPDGRLLDGPATARDYTPLIVRP